MKKMTLALLGALLGNASAMYAMTPTGEKSTNKAKYTQSDSIKDALGGAQDKLLAAQAELKAFKAASDKSYARRWALEKKLKNVYEGEDTTKLEEQLDNAVNENVTKYHYNDLLKLQNKVKAAQENVDGLKTRLSDILERNEKRANYAKSLEKPQERGYLERVKSWWSERA